ncbi:phosphoethanolamine transferase [Sneathiella litorea]|uniref:Phosphoethanolamine--lipid A transferase n=1 Tax=Sneathiella litorea TaxID=2606216 RepID=A0A6L8W7H1_9PROT|nr:phosphoethanolamine--lipid A transferase [Sneathiella litorea]MZR31051.1 phosphoethanolamine--lipid A transferase [Sneathiella litorea]
MSIQTKPRFSLSPSLLLWGVSAYLLVTANISFFTQTSAVYDIGQHLPFLVSQAVVLLCAIMLFATIFSFFLPVRLVAALFLITGAVVAYFSDTLGIIVDKEMIRNILGTDFHEAGDLLNWGLILRVGLLGFLPSILLFLIPVRKTSTLARQGRLATAAVAAVLMAGISMAPFGDSYASLFREHKPLRYFTNPTHPIYSAIKLAIDSGAGTIDTTFQSRVTSANIPPEDTEHELVIVVIGETARADHFSLNGYERETTPKLAKRKDVFSFHHMQSCGTSTAVSLPCMFSLDNREDFEIDKADYTENTLDVLKRAGISILWRDNNTGSQGVATRVNYQRFNTPDTNPVCDEEECRDIGMLTGLDDYIARQDGDILIVLHQIGSHGPAYFKRYPTEYATFTPDCQSKELGTCTEAEIVNAYDNSILYTDTLLDATIAFLEGKQDRYETSMIYLSDHGESLGEMGVYLHGMPRMLAPDTQTHVPFIVWAGDTSDIDRDRLQARIDDPLTHDDFSKILLEVFELIIDDNPTVSSRYILPVKRESYTH